MSTITLRCTLVATSPAELLRLTGGLRSWRWFLFFAPLRVDADLKIVSACSVVVLMASGYCNTLCWRRLQGKASKTHARRLPRSPCSARRFHSMGLSFFSAFLKRVFYLFLKILVFLSLFENLSFFIFIYRSCFFSVIFSY
jgi:hypothetical protein